MSQGPDRHSTPGRVTSLRGEQASGSTANRVRCGQPDLAFRSVATPDRDTGQHGHTAPRHVWVNVTRSPAHRSPGVLLEWRRCADGRWEALVVRAEGGGNIRARSHLEWVRQEHVRPAG